MAATVGVVGARAVEAKAAVAASTSPAASGELRTGIAALVDPLCEGAPLGPWRVERLVELHDGAASLVLRDESGALFQLDVCARDDAPDALVSPGRSEHFSVFLANGGSGNTASFEHHGLAAMAVADVIRHNEPGVSRDGYRTLRERLSTAYDSVKRRA